MNEVLNKCLILMLIIFTGYLIKRLKVYSPEVNTGINDLCFSLLFPLTILMSFYQKDMSIISISFILFTIFLFIINLFYSIFFANILVKDNIGTWIVSANALFRGNFIIMGVPIISTLVGEKGLVLTGIAIGLSQIFYNFASVLFYSKLDNTKINLKKIISNIFKNNMMIGGILGVFLMIFKINLGIFADLFRNLGSISSPLALMCMGYNLGFINIKKYLKPALVISFFKLILFPAIVLALLKFFKFPLEESVVSLVLFGAPVAVNTFTYTKRYNTQVQLAEYYIIVSTLLFIFTIQLFLRFVI